MAGFYQDLILPSGRDRYLCVYGNINQKKMIKTVIYISGIAGGLVLVLRVIGIFTVFPFNDMLLGGGLALTGLAIVLALVDRHRDKKQIDRIMDQPVEGLGKDKPSGVEKPESGGWNMNNSPFRERKSGLTWGGGNIKAANASRGKRREFLK